MNLFKFCFYIPGFLIISIILVSCNDNKQKKNAPARTAIAIKGKPADDMQKIKSLQQYFEHFQEKSGYSGAILVGQNGEIWYEQAFGYADYSEKRPNLTSTPLQLASVSKQFTAVAILLLKERGKLSLDDDVKNFFPAFPYQGITIRMLLQHRSGLPNYIYFCDEYVKDKVTLLSNSFVMALMSAGKPPAYYPPDYRFDYSNTGYMVLASIVEHVSLMPFADFLKKNVFEPLDMHDAFVVNQNDSNALRAAHGYNYHYRPVLSTFLDGVLGDKGIYASVDDLFKWDQALYDGKLLKEETLAEAFMPLSKKTTARYNYGYGWRVYYRSDSLKILYHAGWWEGFESMLIRVPAKRTTMVFLKNTKSGPLPERDSLINLLF